MKAWRHKYSKIIYTKEPSENYAKEYEEVAVIPVAEHAEVQAALAAYKLKAEAQSELLIAYRLGGGAKETTFAKLDKANEALAQIAALKGKG